ncbi:MAG: hypothetical protein GY810_29485 [Aureispira sp.]|nr:hypothetical protein [Aureispira sp.]
MMKTWILSLLTLSSIVACNSPKKDISTTVRIVLYETDISYKDIKVEYTSAGAAKTAYTNEIGEVEVSIDENTNVVVTKDGYTPLEKVYTSGDKFMGWLYPENLDEENLARSDRKGLALAH